MRALALTCDLDYDRAHAHAERCGRRKNRGFFPCQLFPHRRKTFKRQKVNGAMVAGILRPASMTLATFLDKNRTGRFIVSTKRHAMAVIDGAVHDLGPRKEGVLLKQIIVLKVPRRRRRSVIA